MKWMTFVIFALAALVLEAGVLSLFEIGTVRPSLLAVLGLFIALSAPRIASLWSCFVLGIVADLTSAIVYPPAQVAHLIGPNALGFTFGAAMVLQLRGMVMRRQVTALAVLSAVFAGAAAIVVVAIYTIRSWFPEFAPELQDFRPALELMRRWAGAMYTALLAVPVGYILLRWQKLWSFQMLAPGNANWR